MSKNRLRKEVKKKKRINELREELTNNDKIVKRNNEEHKLQVQRGLIEKGFPRTAGMYDALLMKLANDIEELKIKLDGMDIINPTYAYQNNPKWKELQIRLNNTALKLAEDNIAEITKFVEEVEKDIVEQNERIKNRKVQILEELKELGDDVSKIKEKSPDYIG